MKKSERVGLQKVCNSLLVHNGVMLLGCKPGEERRKEREDGLDDEEMKRNERFDDGDNDDDDDDEDSDEQCVLLNK